MVTRPNIDPLSRLSLAGAVPLDPRSATTTGAGADADASGAAVIDVTEASFATDVLQRSQQVPVVLDFWASWCGPCKQLSPVLERLAAEGGGSWVLARVDVDANPRLAQAAGVQGIPAVKAVLDGQVVAEFTGAVPEPQLREWVDALVQAAGPAGSVADPGGDAGVEPVPALATEVVEAEQALARGDLDAAEAAYLRLADRLPGDPEARSGLARVALLRRAGQPSRVGADLSGDVDFEPGPLAARADALVLAGRVEEAFELLVEAVRRLDGSDRDSVRSHLLSLFDAIGEADPRVGPARRALANALF